MQRTHVKRIDRGFILRARLVVIGIVVNVLLSYLAFRLDLPVYLDTIGTIMVVTVGGAFPAILTAVITNLLCSFYNNILIYFGVVNVIFAIITAWFIRAKKLSKPLDITVYVLSAGAVCGLIAAHIQQIMGISMQGAGASDLANMLSDRINISSVSSVYIINILVNIIDKTVALGIATFIMRFMPERVRKVIEDGSWKQKPPTDQELEDMKKLNKSKGRSMNRRMTIILILTSILIVSMMCWVGANLFFDTERLEKAENAQRAAEFVAEILDVDRIDVYIEKGRDAKGYNETEEMITKIAKSIPGIEYLNVVRYDEEYETFIFDCVARSESETGQKIETYEPGEKLAHYDNGVGYYDQLLSGESVPEQELVVEGVWVENTYRPVFNDDGECVCYVNATATVNYLSDYLRQFITQIILVLSGVFVLILAYGLRSTGTNMVFPLGGIVAGVRQFIDAGSDQEKMDEAVHAIRKLDVRTDDEVELLYDSISEMVSDQAEQVRSIRRFSESTANMQDGLIITMADLVESRDSDTGAHVQKTAAYVKIIAEGLQRKGYYAEKVTPKFIANVVRSAPLHDVGKIHIPDEILNKPGKLTDEEYEIMKTHTMAGKKIMEKAISTVKGENYLKEARNMAAYHHERWDGKGYPEGLHGEVIPLSARIMAVADVFDALTSPRVYKPAFSLEKSLQIIQEGAGTQFDAKCVEVFMESLPEVKVILRKFNGTV